MLLVPCYRKCANSLFLIYNLFDELRDWIGWLIY